MSCMRWSPTWGRCRRSWGASPVRSSGAPRWR
nr:MAG TPA: hypothetical protein [Caudoviricetes sp.]